MSFQHRPKTSQNNLPINFRAPKGLIWGQKGALFRVMFAYVVFRTVEKTLYIKKALHLQCFFKHLAISNHLYFCKKARSYQCYNFEC